MIEVEIKAKVDNFDSIKNKLLEGGAEFINTKTQIDRIYGREKDKDHEQKLIEGSFSARIRQVNKTIRVDFKEIIRGSGGMEISIPFTDMKLANKFLNKIGYEKAFTVSKIREVYKLNNYTIALDNVKKLGKFIEIEINTDSEKNKDALYLGCKTLLNQIAPEAQIEIKKYGDLMQELINRKG